MTKQINTKEFEELVLSSDKPVFVDFFATWCGPCKMLGPIMDEISNDYAVYKVDVDQEEDLAAKFGIMSIPCVILFKDGKEISRSVGLRPKDEILKMVK